MCTMDFVMFVKKRFGLGNMGKKAVVSHSKGQLHNKLIKMRLSNTSLQTFLTPKCTPKTTEGETTNQDTNQTEPSNPCPSALKQGSASSLVSFFAKDDVTKADIKWALNVVQNRLSLNSCENISDTFRDMFPDSRIASKFQLGATKCTYIINRVLSPYFDDLLLVQLRTCQNIVVCFDEAMNKVVQRGQVDLFIRFFDINTNRVCTRYFNSLFLGCASTQHLLDGFSEGILHLSKQNILQVSMDGPSVNLKFWKLLDDQMKADFPDGKHLFNIGVCGLHVINGCLRTGMEFVHWDLHAFLRDMFYMFNDYPAQRAEFTASTGGDKFPTLHYQMARECQMHR